MGWIVGGFALLLVTGGMAQVAAPPAALAADAGVEAARAWVGRALILRGFYAGGELSYDASGHVQGQPKVVDWTLAGVSVESVARRGRGEIELAGVRVAIRYNPEQHVFERHAQKEARVRILLAASLEGKAVEAQLAAVFSVGIDPALQRAMPAYWSHYLMPSLPWPADELTGVTVVPAMGKPVEGAVYPVLEKKSEPDFTNEAREDRVRGTVQLRLVVGVDGVPRRIAVRQPLGYGLDARAVEAAARYRFRPGSVDGVAGAFEVIVNQGFDVGVGAYP